MKTKRFLAASFVLIAAVTIAVWYWYSYGGQAASLAGSSDPEQRLQAVRLLRGKSNALALRVLSDLADDSDSRVAIQAVQALGESATGPAGDKLLTLLGAASDAKVRGAAAAALGWYATTDVNMLGKMLCGDESPHVRLGAAKGMARLRDRAGLKYLMAALRDEDDPNVLKVVLLAVQKTILVRPLFEVNADRATRLRQFGWFMDELERRSTLSRKDLPPMVLRQRQ